MKNPIRKTRPTAASQPRDTSRPRRCALPASAPPLASGILGAENYRVEGPRSEALASLSREHHHALVLALKLKGGAVRLREPEELVNDRKPFGRPLFSRRPERSVAR